MVVIVLRWLICHQATITRVGSLFLSPRTSRLHRQYSDYLSPFARKKRRQRTDIDGDTVRRSWML